MPFLRSVKNFFTLAACLFSLQAYAQELTVTGAITDKEDSQPLIGTNIILKADGQEEPAAMAVADAEGKFVLKLPAEGSYTLSLSFVGYQSLSKEIILSKNLDLGTLPMEPDLKLLEEVSIEAQRERVELLGDTLQMNAAAYETMPDGVAEDLLKKMPGMVVQNGKLQAQGEVVKRVLIDGRQFFEGDVETALKNLPAEMIDKIQVFDQLSEQAQFSGFDDGNRSKTINIVTKPGMRNSVFGKGSAGAGNDGKYLAGGNLNLLEGDRRLSLVGQSNNVNMQNFSSEDLVSATAARSRGAASAGDMQIGAQNGISATDALGLNLHDQWSEKLKLTGSYFYHAAENKQTRASRQLYNTEDLREYTEQQQRISNSNNHRFSMRMEYDLNKRNSLLFQPSLNLQQNLSNSLETGTTFVGGDALRQVVSGQWGKSNGFRYHSNLMWRHRFAKAGRTLSWNVGVHADNRTGQNGLTAATAGQSAAYDKDSLNQLTQQHSPGREVSSKLVFTEPLHKGGRLLMEYETSSSWDNSGRYAYGWEETRQEYSLLDSALSNVFDNHYTTHSIGSGYRYNKKAWSVSSNLEWQSGLLRNSQYFPSETEVDYTYNNLLGGMQLSYKANGRSFMTTYRTNTSVPSVSQLQQVVNNSNPLQLRLGNPDLQQQYQHHFTGRYSTTLKEQAGSFMIFAGGTITENYLTTATYVADQDTTLYGVSLPAGGRISMPGNQDGYRSLRSTLSYGRPVSGLSSNLNFNLTGNYSRVPGIVNGVQTYSNNRNLGLGVVLSSSSSKLLDFTLSTNTHLSRSVSSLPGAQNRDFLNQSLVLDLNWIFLKDFIARTNFSQQWYQGLSGGFDQQFTLWNLSVGRKLFPSRLGELNLFVYDLLGQNTSIARHVTEAFVEDVQTDVLQRYFMLRFTYNFRKVLPSRGE